MNQTVVRRQICLPHLSAGYEFTGQALSKNTILEQKVKQELVMTIKCRSGGTMQIITKKKPVIRH